ncbi:hypothetical protein [Anatilimnocola floriformis]|uniref:hypothetical protein n=1 Tax=Anatilimnocola floriformis TaxID=2948575 RepID=UPI0020C59E63|nr:hypothetical protein [Anatilimnocola floriformis]
MASYAFSKVYLVTISAEDVERSPAWSDDAENPPISARKALQLALAMKNSLVKDQDNFKWQLKSAELTPTFDRPGKWYWLVTYEAIFQGGSTGMPPHLRLVVLMDGTVIKPVIKDQK